MTDRVITYAGAGVQDMDIMRAENYARRTMNYLARMVLGSTGVLFNFAVTAAGGTSVTLSDGGYIGPIVAEDATAMGSSPAVLQGTTPVVVNLLPTVLTGFVAPSSAGQSVTHLIYGTYQSTDTDGQVQYYRNAGNPSQVWRGVNNNGVPQPTTRQERLGLAVAVGTPATTGVQVAPVVPPGTVPLYLVTIAYGTPLALANVTTHPSAPYLPQNLPQVAADLINVIAAAGITPNANDTTLFLAALRTLLVQKGNGVNQLNNAVKIGWSAANKLKLTIDLSDIGNFAMEAWVAANFQPIGVYAGVLGFNPVQQGGGTDQGSNKIYIGWSSANKLKGQVDSTDLGNIAFEAWVDNNYQRKGNGQANIAVYGTPGTYTFVVPTNVFRLRFDCLGGGGAGGGGLANAYSGGGGGSGGYSYGYIDCNPGDNISLTVGAGGVPVSAGTVGGTGGTTYFGGFGSATGGAGGGSNSPYSSGGIGGQAFIGSGANGVAFYGEDGSDGQASDVTAALAGIVLSGGRGGSGQFGGGARAATGNGRNGQVTGAGGGGSYFVTGVGGYGANGLVIVRW